ncbi:MAG: type III polyketide synthase [Gammaproteobacteria bacterium]|nr:type III polyketide synthase [Gammaproteobacteria bacterium]
MELRKENLSYVYPRAVGVGTSNHGNRYDQHQIASIFGYKLPRIKKLFENSHIKNRYLYLPKANEDGKVKQEDNFTLLKKHLNGAVEMGKKAIERCLAGKNVSIAEIDYIVCVSSTGFLCPGISAHITKALKFSSSVRRADVLGMGCSAGINGLKLATDFTLANPGKNALVLMVEVCSAAYHIDGKLSTAVVNSLFGDGAAAVLVTSNNQHDWQDGPEIIDFESETISANIDAMRYDVVDGMLSFYLDRDIPYVIGSSIHKPIERILKRNNLKLRNIDHWIIHSGGKKVIDSIKYNINITNHDLRHTLNVLRDYGNMSSCSFLFSYDKLCEEDIVKEGDIGLAVTMGPGVAIETALLRW